MMLLGRIKRFLVERNINKLIKAVMENVERTLQKNPGLTVEDALKIIDKKMGIFFPNEQCSTMDLKSLFTLIVWKSYRQAHISNPDSSSQMHREWVASLVEKYLNDDESNRKYSRKKLLKPVPLAIGIALVMVSALVARTFYSKSLTGLGGEAHKKYYVAIQQNNLFKYSGYSASDYQKKALINKSIYCEGDTLDGKSGYMLKSIHPQYVVIQNKSDRKEFAVRLH